MNDGQDLANCPHAQSDAIEATFRREAAGLTRYFQYRLRGAADPVEFVQEVFARLVSRAHKGVINNPAALMTIIARNLLVDHGRRQKLRIDHSLPFDPGVEVAVQPTQESHVETAQMMDRFHSAVDRLPPRTKDIFLLHHMEELSHKAIALRLEISVRTVEWHMSEALLRLRRMMDE